jgi:hypothetical protein
VLFYRAVWQNSTASEGFKAALPCGKHHKKLRILSNINASLRLITLVGSKKHEAFDLALSYNGGSSKNAILS